MSVLRWALPAVRVMAAGRRSPAARSPSWSGGLLVQGWGISVLTTDWREGVSADIERRHEV
jgi:hypothetical protein